MTDLTEHIDGAEATNELWYKKGLVNLFEGRLGDNLPRTHKRGNQAIVRVYITPNIYQHILKAEMAPFGCGIESDHRAILSDVDLVGLLDPEINIVTPFNPRYFKGR